MAPNAGVARTPNASRPIYLRTLLASPAHLVEADRGDRAEKREAGGQWEQERHEIVVEEEQCQDEAYQRIDHAQEDDVSPVGPEIRNALGQDILEVGYLDPADRRERGGWGPSWRVRAWPVCPRAWPAVLS